jgi:uncharacterized protein YjeT (DUF2065 family)
MALVQTLAILFALIIIVKTTLLLIAPNKWAKGVSQDYAKSRSVQIIVLILSLPMIYLGMQRMPLENALTLFLGFSLLISALLMRYPKSIALITKEAIEDKHLKALSAIWLLIGIYLLYLLLL